MHPCPLPSTRGWPSPPSPHLPHCQGENRFHLQAASAPLPCLGKGRRLGAARWVGVGAGIKTLAFRCQILNRVGCGNWGREGRKERQSVIAPPPGFRWRGGAGGCPLISSWGCQLPTPLWLSDWDSCSGIAGEGRAEATGDSCPLSPRAICLGTWCARRFRNPAGC